MSQYGMCIIYHIRDLRFSRGNQRDWMSAFGITVQNSISLHIMSYSLISFTTCTLTTPDWSSSRIYQSTKLMRISKQTRCQIPPPRRHANFRPAKNKAACAGLITNATLHCDFQSTKQRTNGHFDMQNPAKEMNAESQHLLRDVPLRQDPSTILPSD